MLPEYLCKHFMNNLLKQQARRLIATTKATNAESATANVSVISTSSQDDSTKATNVPATVSQAGSKLKMRAWQIHNYGGLEELQLSNNSKIPQIRSSTDCLVRVHATTVNPIDVAMLGGYGATVLNTLRCQSEPIEFPLTLGREFCGTVAQKGMSVDSAELQLGDRVWGVVPVHLTGSHAEYVTVNKCYLSKVPAALSDEEAASVLYAGLTAWGGLYVTANLGGLCGAMTSSGGGANKRILVLGGSGAVGSLAIQILKSQDAQVLTTCSENATELVRTLGADHVVDYSNPVEMETLRSYGPYDIILDCAGKGQDYAEEIKLDYLQYITFSAPLLRNIDKSGLGLGMLKNLTELLQTNVKSITQRGGGVVKWGFFTPTPQGIQFLKDLVERRKLLPLIDSSYGFDALPAAFERVQKGHLRGKVVIKL